MNITKINNQERSEEYINLLMEFKQSFISAEEIAQRLYEQGKKDGLSNIEIRQDIENALDGVVKERRLREILPLELKRHGNYGSSNNNNQDKPALSADSDDDVYKTLRLKELYAKEVIGLRKTVVNLLSSALEMNYLSDNYDVAKGYLDNLFLLVALVVPETFKEEYREKQVNRVNEFIDEMDRIYEEKGMLNREYSRFYRGVRYITLYTPLLKLMHQNFKDKEEGYRARRAYELHDKLSESA